MHTLSVHWSRIPCRSSASDRTRSSLSRWFTVVTDRLLDPRAEPQEQLLLDRIKA
jgi:hypothetical protein